jgi:dolichyl-phosphate beta-glucosyltransferase
MTGESKVIDASNLLFRETLPARPLSPLATGLRGLTPWPETLKEKVETSATLRLSLLIPAKGAGAQIQETIREANAYLQARFPGDFDILVIPNPDPWDPNSHSQDETLQFAREAAQDLPQVLIVAHPFPAGKGAGLRSALPHCQGRTIFFTDADLPYDLDFIERALPLLESGQSHLVYGNRRLPESRFELPVSVLPYVYSRHRLSLAFNRVVRLWLGIPVTDSQAGIKGLSRTLGSETFSQLKCPGFFFDLELFLVALHHPRFLGTWGLKELPVRLRLESEKSTVRVLREAVLAGAWLLRLGIRRFQGHYGKRKKLKVRDLLKLYSSASRFDQLFLALRWSMTPYEEMAQVLPKSGRILDVGTGHGLFALTLATDGGSAWPLRGDTQGTSRPSKSRPPREIFAFDHDEARIQLATQSLGCRFPQIQFKAEKLQTHLAAWADGSLQGISAIDVLHYFSPEEQLIFLKEAYRLLEPGGRLIFREIRKSAGLISGLNRLYERLATKMGFTQDNSHLHHFRSPEEWVQLCQQLGFETRQAPCSHPLFADILFVAQKPQLPS